ncbi:hypothetical protein [Glaciecola sp. SC05]|uniref:F0F1 ATP synthase subunit B family protein n=1 Tax=Glaciecola sp. SC05 TaxID=1987355 RepID=UPI003528F14D
MLFDWFTVFAQIANFLILMWLLKRFLYKPVLNTIDAREQRIAKLLSETEQSQQQMQEQQAELSAKNVAFAAEREVLLESAKTEAEQLKQQLLKHAANDVSEQRTKWISALKKEQSKLGTDINQRTQQAVFDVARKALKDLSGEELQTQIIHVFTQQLAQMTEPQRQQFLSDKQSELLLRSASPLSEQNKQLLQQTIETELSAALTIQFELAPELLSGIEMIGSGHKLSWNIDDYLSKLEGSISEIVSHTVKRHQALNSEGAKHAVIK